MMWIDGFDLKEGDVGFLVESQKTNVRGCPTRYSLRSRPAHTNMSHEPKLKGWCGETNNISITAEGLARVVRVTKNSRAQIVPLQGEEQSRALKTLGYPELDC